MNGRAGTPRRAGVRSRTHDRRDDEHIFEVLACAPPDQARVRRRREYAVRRPELEVACIPTEHGRLASACANAREFADARQRVERVPQQETFRLLDRPARAPVLVAPVLALDGRTRKLEV